MSSRSRRRIGVGRWDRFDPIPSPDDPILIDCLQVSTGIGAPTSATRMAATIRRPTDGSVASGLQFCFFSSSSKSARKRKKKQPTNRRFPLLVSVGTGRRSVHGPAVCHHFCCCCRRRRRRRRRRRPLPPPSPCSWRSKKKKCSSSETDLLLVDPPPFKKTAKEKEGRENRFGARKKSLSFSLSFSLSLAPSFLPFPFRTVGFPCCFLC